MAETLIAPPRLSEKQQAILAYIEQYIERWKFAPTIREITAACGISSSSVVNYNLNVLERLGFLRRRREMSRAIVLLSRDGICPTCGHRCCG